MERSRSKLTVLDETRLRLERVQERVETQSGISTFDDWHVIGAAGEPAFQNGWVNNGGYGPAAFWRDSAGIVRLRGLVVSGTLATIFTLPAGYRPAYRLLIGNHAGGAEGRLDILTSGDVFAIAGSGYFQLDNISFRAEK